MGIARPPDQRAVPRRHAWKPPSNGGRRQPAGPHRPGSRVPRRLHRRKPHRTPAARRTRPPAGAPEPPPPPTARRCRRAPRRRPRRRPRRLPTTSNRTAQRARPSERKQRQRSTALTSNAAALRPTAATSPPCSPSKPTDGPERSDRIGTVRHVHRGAGSGADRAHGLRAQRCEMDTAVLPDSGCRGDRTDRRSRPRRHTTGDHWHLEGSGEERTGDVWSVSPPTDVMRRAPGRRCGTDADTRLTTTACRRAGT